ncbi:MAG: gliding motility-associated C-terminal domain-containing protein [Saprospiraceae bacterium]
MEYNTSQPNVNTPGWYFLNITNNRNGCQSTDSIEVFENVDIPTVQINNPDTLDCQNPTLSLDGSGSSLGANFVYYWTTTDGSLLSGDQTLNPTVGSAGNYWLVVTDQTNGCKDSLSIEVQVDEDLPYAQIFLPEMLTCTTTAVELDGSASSSGPEFSYSWSTTNGNIVSGINTLNPIVDNPGDYILTIRNTTNACENTVWIEVEENVSNPQISIAPADTLTCSTNSFSLNSSAVTTASNASFNWSTTDGNIVSGNSTARPLINAPGTYEVEVTDLDNGCTSNTTIIVEEDIQSPIIATNNPEELTCIILRSTVSASAIGSGNNFSYNWSTTNGSFAGVVNQAQATVNAPGTYDVLVTDLKNECTGTKQVEVSQDIVNPIASASSTGTITCTNLSVSLDGSASSTGPNFNYNWTTSNGSLSSGSNTLNPTVTSSGTYQLKVTNTNNGCEEITTVNVQVDSLIPAASIATPGLITCIDSSVILNSQALNGLSNGVFSWASTNGQIIGSTNQANITAGLSGTYELTLTDPDNGCYTKETVQVLEDKQLPVVDAGEQLELNCTDSLLNLVGVATAANGSYNVFWSTSNGNILNGQTTLSPLVNQEGTYILQITDPINGCISIDQVTVIRDPNILTQVEPRTVEPLCFGDLGSVEVATTAGGTQPFQFSIDNGASFQNSGFFGNLGAGQYTLLVEDAKGCKAQAAFTIPQLQQNAVDLEARIIVQLGDEMTLYPQTNINPANIGYIEWSPAEGLSCTDCLNPTFIGTVPTTYTVYIEDLNGCGVSDRTTITIEKKFNVYIPSAFSPRSNDGINDSFTIFGDPETITQINTFMIFDRWGEKVFENYNFQPNDPTEGWNGDLRGKLFDSGVFVYFAEIEFIDGTRKIFKGDVTLF